MSEYVAPLIMPIFSEDEKNAKLAAGWTILKAEREPYTDETGTHERIMYVMQAKEEL